MGMNGARGLVPYQRSGPRSCSVLFDLPECRFTFGASDEEVHPLRRNIRSLGSSCSGKSLL